MRMKENRWQEQMSMGFHLVLTEIMSYQGMKRPLVEGQEESLQFQYNLKLNLDNLPGPVSEVSLS